MSTNWIDSRFWGLKCSRYPLHMALHSEHSTSWIPPHSTSHIISSRSSRLSCLILSTLINYRIPLRTKMHSRLFIYLVYSCRFRILNLSRMEKSYLLLTFSSTLFFGVESTLIIISMTALLSCCWYCCKQTNS